MVSRSIGVIAGADDGALLETILADDGGVVCLDFSGAEAAVRAGELAILIVAPMSSQQEASAELADLRAEMARRPVPTFVLVPNDDMKALAYAFDFGAADCAAHPIVTEEVRIRVGALLKRKAVADRLRADAAEIRRIAHTDPVTGLWNRHYLDAELAAAISHASGQSRPLALLMIDIDRFKPINDRHGHVAGDQVLRGISDRLNANIRAVDTLARFGGDELVLVMPDVGIEVARVVADRLRDLVAATSELPCSVTVSIGVAEYRDEETAAALLAKADAALYAAKVGGRNRIAEAPVSVDG